MQHQNKSSIQKVGTATAKTNVQSKGKETNFGRNDTKHIAFANTHINNFIWTSNMASRTHVQCPNLPRTYIASIDGHSFHGKNREGENISINMRNVRHKCVHCHLYESFPKNSISHKGSFVFSRALLLLMFGLLDNIVFVHVMVSLSAIVLHPVCDVCCVYHSANEKCAPLMALYMMMMRGETEGMCKYEHVCVRMIEWSLVKHQTNTLFSQHLGISYFILMNFDQTMQSTCGIERLLSSNRWILCRFFSKQRAERNESIFEITVIKVIPKERRYDCWLLRIFCAVELRLNFQQS